VEQLVLDEEGDLFILDFHYSTTDGIDDQHGSMLTLYPNPAKDRVVIEGVEAAEVQVYNAIGQVVKTVQGSNEINVSGLPAGIYSIRVTMNDGNLFLNKIIKL
jgi:hypothetical protein